MTTTQGTVYRAIAADGAVLYVGMTTSLPRRLREHARYSAWWPMHARIDHDEPLPLDRAFLSEADQIALLRPAFNQIGGVLQRFGPDRSTEREWLEWKARYEAGATIEQIALDARVGPQAVRHHLIAVGTEMRRPGQRPGITHLNRAKPDRKSSPARMHVAPRRAHRRRGVFA